MADGSGTSFPTPVPYNGYTFYRTDLGTEFIHVNNTTGWATLNPGVDSSIKVQTDGGTITP